VRNHPRGSLGICVSLLALFISTSVSTSVAMADPTFVTGVDCGEEFVEIVNVNSETPVTASVTVVLATYPSQDEDCPSGSDAVVQVIDRQETNLAQYDVRTISFDDLGLDFAAGCEVYVVTVRAAIDDTDYYVSSCQPESFPMSVVDGETYRSTIAPELALTNKIDLAAIDGGTCVGGREYIAQACNVSSSSSYKVTVDAKFFCAHESECPENATPGGPSSVQAIHSSDVTAGTCGRIDYLNDQNGASLTRCCDQLEVAANQRHARQCAKFIVSEMTTGPTVKALSPALILDTPADHDGGASTSCTFVPEDTSSQAADGCIASNCGDVDVDGDTVADVSDNCPCASNSSQTNSDGDAYGNACDNCPGVTNANQADQDSDTVGDACDNCPTVANSDQADFNSDNVGDACDIDGDGDPNGADNCLTVYNPTQADGDSDGIGDACDGAQTCNLCPAENGYCDGVPLGSACGVPACGGVCRKCNGNIGCYPAP
jgi:hypothetical protein